VNTGIQTDVISVSAADVEIEEETSVLDALRKE
jgi:hypothetical protein